MVGEGRQWRMRPGQARARGQVPVVERIVRAAERHILDVLGAVIGQGPARGRHSGRAGSLGTRGARRPQAGVRMLSMRGIERLLPHHGLLKSVRVGSRHVRRYWRSLLQSNGRLGGHGSRDVKVALGHGRHGLFANGRKHIPVGHGQLVEQVVVSAEGGVQRLVLVDRGVLSRRALRVGGTDGRLEVLVGRGNGGAGQRGEVARAVAKLVLDGERCQAAHAAASSFLLLEPLCQQAPLEGQGVQRREGRRHLAGARAGQVVQREAGHAGVGGGIEGLGAQVEAAGAIRAAVCHGDGDVGAQVEVGRQWFVNRLAAAGSVSVMRNGLGVWRQKSRDYAGGAGGVLVGLGASGNGNGAPGVSQVFVGIMLIAKRGKGGEQRRRSDGQWRQRRGLLRLATRFAKDVREATNSAAGESDGALGTVH